MAKEISALNRLRSARIAHDVATDMCPHWDYESDGDHGACCERVAETKRELRLAKAAVRKAENQR